MKRSAAALVAASLFFAAPAHAFDPARTPTTSTFLYVSIPLDAKSTREQAPRAGLMLRGPREHQVINVDDRLVNHFIEAAAAGGAGSVLLVGSVAAVAALAVAGGGGGGGGGAQAAPASSSTATKTATTSSGSTASTASGGGSGQTSTPKPPCPRSC